ncbi:phosphate ABC transporter substrate-binding protein [Caulobacter sp. S45]|uniref:phosphate ABC transporter substrate-binding protein n=1 Tax=Caulobacter sp. S45 TaxID=1641861 RepID=UPI00131DF6FD|nr:phosphate ABC transporter substrate-binding protein [Caulobacter sp. S45]
MNDPLVLKTALGKHAHVAPLKDGRVTSTKVKLDFIEFDPLPKAFRRMVREGDLDVSEMAVVNHVLAHHYGKPIVGLAIPLWSRLPHTNLVRPANSEVRGPKDLEGGKAGVRAYAQTSGVWVRGVLKTEYGVDLEKITWITMEDSHLVEYADPPGVIRNATSSGLRELMMAGELRAIMGERDVDPGGVRTVIPDAEAAARSWMREQDIVPINHILSVKTDLLVQHPWLAGELDEMFEQARRVAMTDGVPPPPVYGMEANRKSLQILIDFCTDQQIVPCSYAVDDMFVTPGQDTSHLRARGAMSSAGTA